MSRNSEPCTIAHDGIVHEADKAVLLEIDGEKVWVPLSLVEDLEDNQVTIPEWWMIQESLEDYKI